MSAQPNNSRRESGNAFFIVMVGVVLFAALMFTFSRGARQGGDNLSETQTEMAASELINLAQRYERAVSRLRLKGCSENQISFDDHKDMIHETDGTPYNYANANSPADFSCHVFRPEGGNLTPYQLPADYVVGEDLPCPNCAHPRSLYITTSRVAGHGQESGSAGSELVLWTGRVTRNLCMEINDQLGVPNPGGAPPQDDWDCNADQPFTGSFEDCTDGIGDEAAVLAGQDSFCVDFNGNGWTYIFMTVLIAR